MPAKKHIKEMFWLLLRYSGVPFIVREAVYRNRAGILTYHRPPAEAFEKHIAYLSKRYNFITLERLVKALQNRDWSDIPPKALIITFDDGYKENYQLLELFKRYKLRPTIFLCSHIINTNRGFWWLNGCSDPFALKELPYERMLTVLKEETGYFPEKAYADRQALNKEEILEMSPYVDFQAHTKFHPILPKCADEQCLDEIENSKSFLEDFLNKPIRHFAYPNGDHEDREASYVRKCGYHSARTMDFGWNSIDSDVYRLKGIDINWRASAARLSAQITGISRFFGVSD
ncbi:MAG: polysaccharide deacetylase family protein [Gammaproteobacteria bacterium]|nr:polysaccharide deacetylase family protein [Gammaproteobacteria bacterium]